MESTISDDKLIKPLRLAKASKVDRNVKKILEDNKKHCLDFQHCEGSQLRFKFFFPTNDEFIFGDNFLTALKFLDSKAFLQVFYTGKRLSSATFLNAVRATYGKSVKGIWLA